MNYKDYWTQPPQAQDKLIVASQPKPSYLKSLKPKGCKCKVADARRCFVRQTGRSAYNPHPQDVCTCACHTETGGFD